MENAQEGPGQAHDEPSPFSLRLLLSLCLSASPHPLPSLPVLAMVPLVCISVFALLPHVFLSLSFLSTLNLPFLAWRKL